jgi:uncharacterized cupredoxin-like copper-binding protein
VSGTATGAAMPVAPVGPSPRRHRLLRLVTVLAVAVLAPVGVAVGVAAASAPSGAYAMTVEIDIHWSHYQPASVSVPVGVPVRFVIRNLDPIDHEWIVGDAAVHAIHRSGSEMHHGARPTEVSIAAGETVETVVTFPVRGSQQFICHLPGHEAYGMVGAVDIR